MSRYSRCSCGGGAGYGGGLGAGYGGGLFGGGLFGGTSNCICNFPTLIILILIVLQFSRCGNRRNYDCCED